MRETMRGVARRSIRIRAGSSAMQASLLVACEMGSRAAPHIATAAATDEAKTIQKRKKENSEISDGQLGNRICMQTGSENQNRASENWG